jgi:hypothetical protein
MSDYSVLQLLGENDSKLSALPKENHFTAWLGAFYRRIRTIRGGLVANKAAACKIAELPNRCVTRGWLYAEQGLARYLLTSSPVFGWILNTSQGPPSYFRPYTFRFLISDFHLLASAPFRRH